MHLVPVKSEKSRVIQCRKDTENMRYHQEGRPFGQHQPAHNLDRPIQPYLCFQDSRRVASSTVVSHTNFAILSVQFCRQRQSAGGGLRKHWGLGLAYDADKEACRER